MNVARTIVLCAIAAAGSALAIDSGSNATVALPAAVLAVVAGAILLVEVVAQTRWPTPGPTTVVSADPAWIRSAFEGGLFGRVALVQMLDRLERSAGQPNRPLTPPKELDRIRTLSRDQFREYLATRLSVLERQP